MINYVSDSSSEYEEDEGVRISALHFAIFWRVLSNYVYTDDFIHTLEVYDMYYSAFFHNHEVLKRSLIIVCGPYKSFPIFTQCDESAVGFDIQMMIMKYLKVWNLFMVWDTVL